MAKAADYEALSRKERQRLEREIQKLYRKAVDDAAAIGAQLPPLDPNKPLDFAKNKSANKSINRIIKRLNDGISRAIARSCEKNWDIANQKNDTLVKDVIRNLADNAVMQAYEARMLERNTAARDAFIKKAEEGFKGSSRIWNNEMFKSELELAMSLGLEKGQSAGSLARDLRHYLNAPDMLFRRVRDKYGNLVLSQRAKAYHPGQGVYRSAYKNALRFAGTTTNMAYRSADYERIQNEHFVVGIEIHLSNNHTTKNSKGEEEPLHDICDILQGKYPKDFMWSGWHPNCRCYMTTILKTAEESREDLRRVMRGEQPLPPEQSKNYVGDTPQAFKDWIVDNDERLARSSSLPYFVRDNAKYVDAALYKTEKAEMELARDNKDAIPEKFRNSVRYYAETGQYKEYADKMAQANKASISAFNGYRAVYKDNPDVKKLVAAYRKAQSPYEKQLAINAIVDKCAAIQKEEFDKAGVCEGLKYVGVEHAKCFLPKNPHYGYDDVYWDALKYTDRSGREYYFTLGQNQHTVQFRGDDAKEAIYSMPGYLKREIHGIVITQHYHPADKYYAKIYPNFTHGAMYSGDPITVHHKYYSIQQFRRALEHEAGHRVDYGRLRITDGSRRAAWEAAMKADGNYITEYAKSNISEDIAETFGEMAEDAIYVRRKCPNRYRLLKSWIQLLNP